jgi:hypothetical protein
MAFNSAIVTGERSLPCGFSGSQHVDTLVEESDAKNNLFAPSDQKRILLCDHCASRVGSTFLPAAEQVLDIMLHIVLNLVELRRHHHIGLIGGALDLQKRHAVVHQPRRAEPLRWIHIQRLQDSVFVQV